MVGILKFSPQEYLIARWDDEKWRKPFLFSAGIHLAILLIALLPSSLFHFSRSIPVVYTVDLFDLEELPTPSQDDFQEMTREENAATPEQTRSLQPLLSTRTIPKAPTEIKLIRPRALKKDVRLPPMDPSMVLAALNRIQQQKQVVETKEKALEAIRKSILARESDSEPVMEKVSQTKAGPGADAAALRGMAAHTAIKNIRLLQPNILVNSGVCPKVKFGIKIYMPRCSLKFDLTALLPLPRLKNVQEMVNLTNSLCRP